MWQIRNDEPSWRDDKNIAEYSGELVEIICKIFEISGRLQDETLDDDKLLNILQYERPEEVQTGLYKISYCVSVRKRLCLRRNVYKLEM